ncbi:sugar transferase [Patescibacteria group bacterium]|nr:sugar transferase [Patescibacteria group bacterium]
MDTYDIFKRIIDIAGSIVGIIIFSPIMLVAAIWIKLVSSDGPILADIPHRVGKNQRPFRFYKFRSMIPNAHEYLVNNKELYKKYVDNNYKLREEDDPRIIKGGAFMRKYSIDELPQFFNVFKGDMSMVGPRAYYFYEIEEQSKRYKQAPGYIREVLTAKPGITGTWQVSGRSEVAFLERIKMDAKYAKKRSILYDLLVILKTPYVVLTGKGAY